MILISTLSYSQNKSEIEVFRKVVDHEITNGEIYIQCDKQKTFFDSTDYKSQTELEVPANILQELEKNAERSNDGMWEPELFAEFNYGADLLKSKNCLSKEEVEQLFEKSGKRESVISISEPIFDKNYENCVVSVTFWKFKGSAYRHSYFLKKVFGIWTIISVYKTWMT